METTDGTGGGGGGGGGGGDVSIARGGPIYVPNMVGPLTRVPEFESALLQQLHDLKSELCPDSSTSLINHHDDDDISVDELKIYTDEDLMEMALNQTLNDETKQNNENCSSQHNSNSRTHNDLTVLNSDNTHREGGDPSPALESLNGGTSGNGTTANKSRKRKRSLKSSDGSNTGTIGDATTINNNSSKGKARKLNKLTLNEICLAMVDEPLKLKQKQDQEKAAARLHSLCCKTRKGPSPSSERTEEMKYLKFINSGQQQLKPSNVQEHIAVQYPDVVLCIEVYHNIRHWLKTQEFLVLGRQTLTEMRDKIYCMTDQVMQKAGQHDLSGYFFIEDVFCNDLRDPSAIDYSEPIFDWLRTAKDDALRKWECIMSVELQQKQKAVVGEVTSHLPQFRRVEMQKTRFCDLRFRLGAGYLYCHQGDCKHTIVIRDMRLIHPEDVQNQAVYPIVIFQLKIRVQKCNVCRIFRATKLTVDDKWAPHNPCYFCNDCYYLLHYSENGSLLYSDFSTYDYLHD